jgi:Golgi apparatus protein 1
VEEISDACNNVLWRYRKNITEEAGFLKLADQSCIQDFKKTGCWMDIGRKQPGFNMVNCIIDNKDKIEKLGCQTLITRLEGVIFGDYEMIEQFAKNCEEDILKYKCGRNDFGTVLKKV